MEPPPTGKPEGPSAWVLPMGGYETCHLSGSRYGNETYRTECPEPWVILNNWIKGTDSVSNLKVQTTCIVRTLYLGSPPTIRRFVPQWPTLVPTNP